MNHSLRRIDIPTTDPEAGLKITEIFYSLQGEALTAGLPTIFIRLTGCPLRCVYCDTEYAFVGGERMSLAGILAVCQSFPCQRVCLTGGEPLAQPNAIALMNLLLAHGYEISLETSGALSVAGDSEDVLEMHAIPAINKTASETIGANLRSMPLSP